MRADIHVLLLLHRRRFEAHVRRVAGRDGGRDDLVRLSLALILRNAQKCSLLSYVTILRSLRPGPQGAQPSRVALLDKEPS